MERLEAIDAKLGTGVGAAKERAKWQVILDEWEQQDDIDIDDKDKTVSDNNHLESEEDDEDDDDNEEFFDETKFVKKHHPEERVALYGGDPARRRQLVEKKLAPYQTLDQYGTPRDVGSGDTSKLLRKIQQQKLDVVYLWTKFNNHNSRNAIQSACQQAGIRYHEIESLSYIRWFKMPIFVNRQR